MKRSKSLLALGGTLCALFAPAASGAEDSLSGVYLYIQKTTSVTKMPVLSDVVATTRAVSIQNLTFDGEWLRGTGTLCDVQIESSSKLVKTVLPAAFRRAIPPVQTNARLQKTRGTMTFTQPPQTLVIGAELDSAERDSLPSDPRDARVRDHDGDGKPGVTVLVSGIISGEIYLAQRSTSHLTGHKTQEGFRGTIHFTNDQSILDATKNVLKRNPSAQPDPDRSEFLLRKVDGQPTCAEARRLAQGF